MEINYTKYGHVKSIHYRIHRKFSELLDIIVQNYRERRMSLRK